MFQIYDEPESPHAPESTIGGGGGRFLRRMNCQMRGMFEICDESGIAN